MATFSNIEWTEMTWNPVTGCVKVSQGCKKCYAERMAHRLHLMGSVRYANEFAPTLHHDLVDLPRRWKKPRTIFVNSMSDLFQEAVPLDFIRGVFETMAACPQHVFQPRNGSWTGVSVHFAGFLARRDDDAGFTLLGGTTRLGSLQNVQSHP